MKKTFKAKDQSSLFRFFFIKTVFSTLVMILILMSGYMAYHSLVKEAMPDLQIAKASVSVAWPGASAESVEKEVTSELEKKIKTIKGVKKLVSGSMSGSSTILVDFTADIELREAMQMLREKVADAESAFPSEVLKPEVMQMSMSEAPVITFMFYGNIDEALLDKTLRKLKKQLEKIEGVNKVNLSGTREEIVMIQLIPERIAALSINPVDIKQKINESNMDMPWGKFENPDYSVVMQFSGKFNNIEDIKKLPVKRFENGRLVRLGEVAEIRRDLDEEKVRTSVSWNGKPFRKSVDLSVSKATGKDSIGLVNEVKNQVRFMVNSPDWPENLEYEIVHDDSVTIWEKLTNMFDNCWQAMLCVFVVLLLILTWREALVAGLAIPVTFLGALAVLWLIGYTLNEMVIIGMVLALGLLVDDFILMMEGMHDSLAEGHSISDSQTVTLKLFAIPSLSGSLTTILAFLPLMFMSGIDGKFIRLVPVTATVCLILSYFGSIFVVVPLSRYILKENKKHDDGEVKLSLADRITHRASNYVCDWINTYAVSSKKAAVGWIVVSVAIFLFSAGLFIQLPFVMYPKEDNRDLGITLELAPESTLDESQKLADSVGEVLRNKPYFSSINKYVGRKSPLASGGGFTQSEAPYMLGFNCKFIPKEKREKPAYMYLAEIRKILNQVTRDFPGASFILSANTGGASNEAPIQISLNGTDMDDLRRISEQVKESLSTIQGATDVSDSLGTIQAAIKWAPNREAIDFYNMSAQSMASQIKLAMSTEKVGSLETKGLDNDLDIKMGTKWQSRGDSMGGPLKWEELSLINVVTPQGKRISAEPMLFPTFSEIAQTIVHKDGKRGLTITAKTEGRTAGEIMAEFMPKLAAMEKSWPEGYYSSFGGAVKSQKETTSNVAKGFVIAFFLIFAMLSLLFDNFRQPFIIMFSVPFALIGTFLGFYTFGIDISFPALVGVISLAGIAVNDAIVLIETMNNYVRGGIPVKEAAARGAADRLRPIISTTITTAVGLIPLGLSSAMWMPLCNAIIFGLIASTVISMVVIPGFFLLLTKENIAEET